MPTNDWLPTFSFQDILQGEDLTLTEDFSNQNSALEFFEKEGSSVLEDQEDQSSMWTCQKGANLHHNLKLSLNYQKADSVGHSNRPPFTGPNYSCMKHFQGNKLHKHVGWFCYLYCSINQGEGCTSLAKITTGLGASSRVTRT